MKHRISAPDAPQRPAIEFVIIFLATPLYFYFHATRWNIHAALWVFSIYALILLIRSDGFSWRDLWHGQSWSLSDRKKALLRFFVSTLLIILLTQYLAPYRLLTFPIYRPGFWLLVMVAYPILSVLPQELIFRAFFFRRFKSLFLTENILMAMNAFCFAFIHIVFHNWVSPTLCLIAGAFFAHSYRQHRSLKWAMIEHAAYGCMVFTVGIGFYFLVGGATRLQALSPLSTSFTLLASCFSVNGLGRK